MKTWMVAGVALLGLAGCDSANNCQDVVRARIPSPDGKHEAVYSLHDCGATTTEASWIRIVPHGAAVDGVEPVVTFGGELVERPAWEHGTLVIRAGGAKPFQTPASFDGIPIVYKRTTTP